MFRLSTAVLAVLVAASAAAAPSDPLRVHLFSEVDRGAVEVGGLLQINLEVLAVPASEAAHARLVEAFGAWEVGEQLGDAFRVVQVGEPLTKVTGDVVELQRRLLVRVQRAEIDAVPALHLEVPVGGRTWTYTTSPHRIRTYGGSGAIDRAERSVVAVTAEGLIDGIPFVSIGSAFVIGDDALVTAYHVVVGARRVRVLLPSGREVTLDRSWALDPGRDVAVLYLPADVMREEGLRPLVIAPEASDAPVTFTAGWPGGARQRTVGARYGDLPLDDQRVRMAANAVQPGDSGGPLLDEEGRVLGVVVSGRQTGGRRDLLAEPITLASNPIPAVRGYQAAEAPVRLSRALDEAAHALPAARAHAAVGAIQVPVRRSTWDLRSQVARLREALRQAPDDAVLQYMAGMMFDRVGEDRLAEGALDASRRAGYAPAGYSLAHHLMGRGDLAGAADLFADMAATGPYRRLAALGQAQALVGLGRYALAEEALATVLDHDARFAPALYLLGIVRLAEGRVDEARALSVRLAARPGWADALRVPVEVEALRPPTLVPMPRLAMR